MIHTARDRFMFLSHNRGCQFSFTTSFFFFTWRK